jgi:hypothetical protein
MLLYTHKGEKLLMECDRAIHELHSAAEPSTKRMVVGYRPGVTVITGNCAEEMR